MGKVYVLYNEKLWPGQVEIGYAEDPERYVRDLNNNFSEDRYTLYATYETKARNAWTHVLSIINVLNPLVRHETMLNRFFLSPESAHKILAGIAGATNTEEHLKKFSEEELYQEGFSPEIFSQKKPSRDNSSSKREHPRQNNAKAKT